MATKQVDIGEEVGDKRTFVWALDWPGWCRSGKTCDLAREALAAYRPRYALVALQAGLDLPDVDVASLRVVDTGAGGGGTEFGVPSNITPADRRRVTGAEAERLANLVEAAWTVFERVAAGAPALLRKGPRGGGRDRDKMIDHVLEADHAYAREIGLRLAEPKRSNRKAIEAERAAVLDVLRQPSDGSPIADRKWTARYAARRIAWHALDHAWEMEDRSEPA
jgi:hypothetical protein